MKAKTNDAQYRYPGDEAIYKSLGETLRELRLEKGMSLEQAEEALREALATADHKAIYRALGLTVREAREQENVSRRELSRQSGLSLREVILLERGQLRRVPAAYFFRISYALNIRPFVLARRFEAIQENITRSPYRA